MSTLNVDKVDPQSGTALEIGTSGDTISIPSGATLDISASTLTPPATMPASSGINFTALNATNLGSGTVPTARLGTGTASSSTVLYGDQTYKAEPGGGDMQPYFMAYLALNQLVDDNVRTRIEFATVIYDEGDDLDLSTTKGRFTPQVAGDYMFYLSMKYSPSVSTAIYAQHISIMKNGSDTTTTAFNHSQNQASIPDGNTTFFRAGYSMNGTSDYVDPLSTCNITSGIVNAQGNGYCLWSGYKLI